MPTASEDEINDWVQAISDLHASVATDPTDAQAASEAAANLWSGFGYQDAPTEVLRMFVQAVEIGYITARRDLRDGSGGHRQTG